MIGLIGDLLLIWLYYGRNDIVTVIPLTLCSVILHNYYYLIYPAIHIVIVVKTRPSLAKSERAEKWS